MLDHLVYAVPDLDRAVDVLADRLGVRPAAGGRHERWGTQNALLGLGARSYLEVVGPDPGTSAPAGPRPFGIDELREPRLVTWCVAPPDLDAAVSRARMVGYDPGEPFELSRVTPEGLRLVWRLTLDADAIAAGGIVPFLIDWGTAPHPSLTAPTGVTLRRLVITHPRPSAIRPILEAVTDPVPVDEGPEPTLVAHLDTPWGHVELR
jgi:catechol 2,3-dioxygenase-like lactoylglutathione lyase family enzyme